MSELDQLHAEVLQRPEADEPRVAYADAIAPTDPPRAELIRVQLELAIQLRTNVVLHKLADGFNRQRQLLDKHKAAWSDRVNEVPGVKWVGFLRGFPEHIEMTARAFLDHGGQLYSHAPVLHLDLVDVKLYAAELFRSPLLGRIHSLKLRKQRLDDNDAKALAASPHLGQLRWIDLVGNQIGAPGIEAIAASTGLPSLRWADFGDNPGPDPTPQIGETDPDSNDVMSIEIPPAARELEARFGKKAWLSPRLTRTFPPGRDQF